jgi:hypothetical protein
MDGKMFIRFMVDSMPGRNRAFLLIKNNFTSFNQSTLQATVDDPLTLFQNCDPPGSLHLPQFLSGTNGAPGNLLIASIANLLFTKHAKRRLKLPALEMFLRILI